MFTFEGLVPVIFLAFSFKIDFYELLQINFLSLDQLIIQLLILTINQWTVFV